MSEEKKRTTKTARRQGSNTVIVILCMVIAALMIALGVMVFQYHELTEDIIASGKKQETDVEAASAETETAGSIKVVRQETERVAEMVSEAAETESGVTETVRDEENENVSQTWQQTENGQIAQSSSGETQTAWLQNEAQPVTQPQTQGSTQPQSQPSTGQAVHTAKELTIADIPNSLYGKFQDPEELRSTLFSWLERQGAADALYCTCDYEYTEEGQNITFLLRFSGFNVSVIYNMAGNTYSYGVA